MELEIKWSRDNTGRLVDSPIKIKGSTVIFKKNTMAIDKKYEQEEVTDRHKANLDIRLGGVGLHLPSSLLSSLGTSLVCGHDAQHL